MDKEGKNREKLYLLKTIKGSKLKLYLQGVKFYKSTY